MSTTSPGNPSADGSSSTDTNLVANQLVALVPSFDPSKDDLEQYVKKVEMLSEIWPEKKFNELTTRLILQTTGSAFQKLSLIRPQLMTSDKKGVQGLVQALGGSWGKIDLELKYECAEKAIFRCQQKTDETNDSYLARADVMWAELLAKKMDLSELQAYIMLRGSQLSAEDKKRVLLEADIKDAGELKIDRVSKAIRMLGAGFFQQMSGQAKTKGKIYEGTAMMAEDREIHPEDGMVHADDPPPDEEEMIEALAAEGDEDAALILDYESAAADTLQEDTELASAYNAYIEARRRLSERHKNRGFWPTTSSSGSFQRKGKWKSFSSKGKGKGQSFGKGPRKSLQQRIMETECRLCGKRGHWKAECPERSKPSAPSSSPGTAATSVLIAESADAAGLPLEFVELPELPIDESCFENSFCLACMDLDPHLRESLRKRGSWGKPYLVRNDAVHLRDLTNHPKSGSCEDRSHFESEIMFATHDSMGILDSGATKSVVGSDFVGEILASLRPEIRKNVKRCQCKVTFRFGNQGVLTSQHALVIPVERYLLKIAVVMGRTPLLLSNTLVRALEGLIDTKNHVLICQKVNRRIPLHLNSKGLFLLDLNDLASPPSNAAARAEENTVTFVSLGEKQSLRSNSNEKIEPPLKPFVHECEKRRSVQQLVQKFEGTSRVSSKIRETSSETAAEKDLKKVTVVPPETETEHAEQPVRQICQDSVGRERISVRRAGKVSEDVPGRDEPGGDHLRESSPRKDVCSHVGKRESLGEVHDCYLRSIPEGRTSEVHDLCGSDDREKGTRTREQQGDNPDVSTHRQSSQGSSQSQGISIVVNQESPAGNSVLGRQRESLGTCRSSRRDSPGNPSAPEPHVAHGECLERGREFHPCSAESSRGTELRTDSAVGHVFAGDSEAECWTKNQFPETVKECQHSLKAQFFQWVQDLTKELEVVEQSLSESSCRPIHLLEVFCSEQSELTKQAMNLGYRARRFGFEQGDLSTPEGRRSLFEIIVNYKPKHIWYSPTCGPWCPWSWLNESMSLEACLKMQQKREDHLYQLALGIVILRKAKEIGSHCHWEQPQRGLMFKCPFLAELHESTYCASFDMCNVGQLKDPVSHLPIKKGTDLCTTSWNVYQALNGRNCRQDHAHQEISGTTRCKLGTVARSKFTERYTRRFARFVAKTMLKIKTIKEKTKPNGFEETCAIFAEPSGRASKKSRVSSPIRQYRRRSSEAAVDTEPKRRRIEGKSPPENTIENVSESIQKAVESCISLAPRVGKKDITSEEILEMFQRVFVDKRIVKIMTYKGTDRAQAPPRDLFKNEAPFRRNIYLRRSDGKIVMDPKWESWSHLSKRQLCRHAIPARVCITLYACNPVSNSENAAQPQVTIENSKPPEQSWSRPETVEVLTPGMKADFESNKHGPRFLQLSREERSLLIRMRKNLGHPSPSQMYQVLKQNQASPRIVQGCLDLQCSICQSTKKPRIARPSSLKDELDFNDRIGVDGMEFTNNKGKVFHCYHVLDYGTSFHVACAAPNRSAEEVIENMSTCWFNWAGPPREIFTDAATEFTSEKFSDFLMKNNVRPVTIAPEAHWQLGKVERHGQTLQNMLKKYDLEHPIEDYHEFRQALNLCCSSKNALSLRKGFSPDILVFGKAVRLPGSIVSDEQLPSHLTADEDSARGISFRQQLARRETARRAFHECDNDMAMRRSILRRSRPTRESYSPGEWVMCWKKTGNLSSWIGPARVVQHYDQNNMWCEHLGRVFKTTPETTRPVTALEAQTIPPWNWPRDENQVRQESQTDDYSLELPSENPHNQEQLREVPSEIDNRRHSHQSTEQPDLEPETQQHTLRRTS